MAHKYGPAVGHIKATKHICYSLSQVAKIFFCTYNLNKLWLTKYVSLSPPCFHKESSVGDTEAKVPGPLGENTPGHTQLRVD